MNNNFGFDLRDYYEDPNSITTLAANYLNLGHLGLVLGAGASMAIDLPGWKELVFEICKSQKVKVPRKKNVSNEELKELIDKVKLNFDNEDDYIESVRQILYKDVNLDFELAKKDLLIALSSLAIGKHRGTVQDIITYNFDCILEWYLNTLGLNVNSLSKSDLLLKRCDVVITHIHGYLPVNDRYGVNSEFLIFSKEEFIDRMIKPYEYWKESLFDFSRKHVMLIVGMSSDSIIDDLIPYLRENDRWYEREKISRQQPYGIALMTESSFSIDKVEKLLRGGIIPCFLSRTKIPEKIFAIVQSASNK